MNLDLTTSLNQHNSARLGVVTLANPNKDLETIRGYEREITETVRALGATPILCDRLVMDRDSLVATLSQLDEMRAHGLLVVFGSYSPDDYLLDLANAFYGPLLLWAPVEKLSPDSFPPFASLVGLTQSAGTLKRLGYHPYPIYGASDSQAVRNRLSHLLHVLSALNMLHGARIGRVGPGCPGMLDTQFDSLLLRQRLGLEVVDIPIQTFIDRYQSIQEDQTAVLIPQIRKMDPAATPADMDYIRSLKGYIALRQLIAEHGLLAVTVRCWPELKECDVVAPCLALSLLTNQGLPAGCEGDALGTVSMLIAQLLARRPAFFGDLVAVDSDNDEAMLFHCGAGAAGLAQARQGVNLRTHSRPLMWKPGVTVEFPVKGGAMTYLRLGQVASEFRLLVAGGIATRHRSFCRGTTARFKPHVGGQAFLSELMAAGAEHHIVLAQGDVSRELFTLCDMWGIRSQTVSWGNVQSP